jgi:2-oxoisovalerate dehydrogenase E2 component (dihydrolipoyl transacylase)
MERHRLSDIGEGVKEVQIIQWFVEEGAAIEEWDPLCEVQSDKATVDITSKFTGVVRKKLFDQDAVVQVGDDLVEIEVAGEDETASRGRTNVDESPVQSQPIVSPSATSNHLEEADTIQTQNGSADGSGKVSLLATPAVKGLLKKHGLSLDQIQGTGPKGRVLKGDVNLHISQASPKGASSAPKQDNMKPKSSQLESIQSLNSFQMAMFRSMTSSLAIPHFLYTDTADITGLTALRRRLNSSPANCAAPKLSYLPFVMKALSLALHEFPTLNSRVDVTANPSRPSLVLRSNHNIGVAMDTSAGLVVPVVRGVDQLSIMSIAREIKRLSISAQAGRLHPNDYSGGTITVTNIGTIGGEVIGPVIVEGQVAILGMGRIKTVPVFAGDGKTVQPAQVVNLSWSADHRVVDGATIAKMARMVQMYLEDPALMFPEQS